MTASGPRLLFSAIIATLLALSPTAAFAQTIRFIGSADLPAGLTVEVLSGPGDFTPTRLPKTGDDWVYSMPADPKVWRTEPNFVVTIPARNDPEGITAPPITTQLAFSIRALDIETPIEVPLVVYQSFSSDFLLQIEKMPDHQIWQQLQSSEQLALHFAARIPNPQDRKTQRMTKFWFETLHKAIIRMNPPLRVPPDLMDGLHDAFEVAESDTFDHRFADLRSTFWYDKDLLDEIEAWQPSSPGVDRCSVARALYADLSARHEANPTDAHLRFNPRDGDPAVLAANALATVRAGAEAICAPAT